MFMIYFEYDYTRIRIISTMFMIYFEYDYIELSTQCS